MSINRGTAPELLEPWVTHIFFQQLTRTPDLYSQCFKMDTSTKAFEDYFEVAGFTTFAIKDEGKPIGYDDFVQGPRTRITFTTFALGYRLTEEMIDDEQHGIIAKLPADLADSAKDHREQFAWRIFNLGFDTSQFTTIDNVALFSASHTLLKSGNTQPNILSPALDLTNEALESMLTLIRLQLSNEGRPIVQNPMKLLVPPELEWQAQKILESEYEPFTADNTINVMKNSRTGLTPFVSRYLTDTDAWFIQCDNHTATWWDRKPLDTDSYTDGATKDQLHDARYRAAVAMLRYYGSYGSAGN